MSLFRKFEVAVLLAGVAALAWSVVQREVGVPRSAQPLPTAAVLSSTTARAERQLELALTRVQQRPSDPQAQAQLGLLYLARARATSDPAHYSAAEYPLRQALGLDENHGEALIGLGTLALARHEFEDALIWGDRAVAAHPKRAAGYGVVGDAAIELGRYDVAFAAYDRMADLRPDLNAYSRLAHARELLGDVAGAAEMFELAIDAASPGSEPHAWAWVQLGQLRLEHGDLVGADRAYAAALSSVPDYPAAGLGRGRLALARGDLQTAIALLATLVTRVPLPEGVTLLAEAYRQAGQTALADAQRDVLFAIDRLQRANGVVTDLELVRYRLALGDDHAGLLAGAVGAYERRPSVAAADTLAWVLLASGDCAGAALRSAEALRLGTADATFHIHAGLAAHCLGDGLQAQTALQAALEINPYVASWHPPARALQLALTD